MALENVRTFRFLKLIFLLSYDNLKTLFITVITQKEFRRDLGHLTKHKVKHSFQDTINPLCSGEDVEPAEHFLLHCPHYVNERRTLLTILGNLTTIC